MDWLIDHPDERQTMGLRGRERMVEPYGLRVLIWMHEARYREVLDGRSRRMV